MNWENKDTELLQLYQKLIKLRKAHNSLRLGDTKIVYARKNVIAYLRRYEKEVTCVMLNNSEQTVNIQLPDLEEMKISERIPVKELGPFQFEIFTI